MKDITDYLEKEQVDQILGAAKTCSIRDYLVLRILWRTSIRVSELLSSRPQNLEPHNQVINILKAKGNNCGTPHIKCRVKFDPQTIERSACKRVGSRSAGIAR